MNSFPVHTVETAPAASRPLLQRVHEAFGFVPNLAGTLAESPAALETFLALGKAFDRATLSATEKQIVLLATSFSNECHYCMAAHTVIAGMHKVPQDVIAALRDGSRLADSKLEALRAFTVSLVEERGRVSDAKARAFLAAGYTRSQMLDVIVGVTDKTLTNYVNHIAQTPLDLAFQTSAWKSRATAAA